MDVMLGGGIPVKNQVVLAGGPGTGKTLIAFEYLYNGAKNGEVGMFFSFNEDTEIFLSNVKDSLSGFTDINKLIEDKTLIIYGYEETKTFMQKGTESANYAFTSMISQLQSRMDDYHASRVAIDSLSYLRLYTKDLFEYRNLSTSLLTILNRQNVTSILTSEYDESTPLQYQQEFFIYDGFMLLCRDAQNRVYGSRFEIKKMRGTKHDLGSVSYELSSNGATIFSAEF